MQIVDEDEKRASLDRRGQPGGDDLDESCPPTLRTDLGQTERIVRPEAVHRREKRDDLCGVEAAFATLRRQGSSHRIVGFVDRQLELLADQSGDRSERGVLLALLALKFDPYSIIDLEPLGGRVDEP